METPPDDGEGEGGEDADQDEEDTGDDTNTHHITLISHVWLLHITDHALVLQLRHLARAHPDGLHGVDHAGLLARRVHRQIESYQHQLWRDKKYLFPLAQLLRASNIIYLWQMPPKQWKRIRFARKQF